MSYPLVKRDSINAMDVRRYDGMALNAIGSQFVCYDLPYYYFNPKGMLLCKSDCAQEDSEGMCCFVPNMYW